MGIDCREKFNKEKKKPEERENNERNKERAYERKIKNGMEK